MNDADDRQRDPPKFDSILYSVAGGVATITLNRPEQMNAIDHGPGSMQRQLVLALEHADQDPDVRCVVVTGAGRAFSSGGLTSAGGPGRPRGSAADWYWFHVDGDIDNERIRELRKPVVGAINGICYGFALMMAMHFDILIASDRARFGLIETRFGATGADILAYHVGAQWAKFLTLSGELISAAKAKEIGLVLEVVPADKFDSKVRDLARRIAAMPPDAVMFNRRVINAALTNMGWKAQKQVALGLNAVTNSLRETVTTADGRKLGDILKYEGWAAYKAARDGSFTPPWLDD